MSDEIAPNAVRAHQLILAGPDSTAKRFLLNKSATIKKMPSDVPQDRQSRLYPTNSTPINSIKPDAPDQPDEPDVPVGYKKNPDYDENYVPPDNGIPF